MRLEDHTTTEYSSGTLRVKVIRGDPPAYVQHFRSDAEKVDEYDIDGEGERLWIGASTNPDRAVQLIVDLRFRSAGGFNPGLHFASEHQTLFVGAGERLLCYRMGDDVHRLWEERTDCGFWSWRQYGDIIVMAAELELAAWHADGTKLWTTFVEPPWDYSVVGSEVRLDVMGKLSTLDLRTG